MKKIILGFCSLLGSVAGFAQDTFSIVAVDSVTGEVGSAGASCLGIIVPIAPHGAQIISDVIPGIGAIHTQAQYDPDNQQHAHTQMLGGLSPQQIVTWLQQNDFPGDSSIRQYGVVDYHAGHPRSAAFTGSNCFNYKGHITGPNYSIQGNILLGKQILDSIEARFLRANGPLADKLMAALQGANVPGADTRCAPNNTSSLSSFIRVARSTDSIGGRLYLDLYMAYDNNVTGTLAVDPIDSLQTLFNDWKSHLGAAEMDAREASVKIFYDHNMIPRIELSFRETHNDLRLLMIDQLGRTVMNEKMNEPVIRFDGRNPGAGIFYYTLLLNDEIISSGKLLFAHP